MPEWVPYLIALPVVLGIVAVPMLFNRSVTRPMAVNSVASNAVVVNRSGRHGPVLRWLAIAIVAALGISAFIVSDVVPRISASNDCHQVREIYAASSEGRDVGRARTLAGERGFRVDVEEAGDPSDTMVTLSKYERRIGWWRVGSRLGANCVFYPGVSNYH